MATVKAAMHGKPFWQRLLTAYDFAKIPKYEFRPPTVQTKLNNLDEDGQSRHYRDIDLDELHMYAPADGIQPGDSLTHWLTGLLAHWLSHSRCLLCGVICVVWCDMRGVC